MIDIGLIIQYDILPEGVDVQVIAADIGSGAYAFVPCLFLSKEALAIKRHNLGPSWPAELGEAVVYVAPPPDDRPKLLVIADAIRGAGRVDIEEALGMEHPDLVVMTKTQVEMLTFTECPNQPQQQRSPTMPDRNPNQPPQPPPSLSETTTSRSEDIVDGFEGAGNMLRAAERIMQAIARDPEIDLGRPEDLLALQLLGPCLNRAMGMTNDGLKLASANLTEMSLMIDVEALRGLLRAKGSAK